MRLNKLGVGMSFAQFKKYMAQFGVDLDQGEKPVTASPSGPGLEIQDGSDTRSFLTAEMSDGVPTGNFS